MNQTGASTGIFDLVDKFRLFAIALGWTVDHFDNAAPTCNLMLTTPAGKNFSMQGRIGGNSDILMYANTGFDNGLDAGSQPGHSTYIRTYLPQSAFVQYWLFGDAEDIYCVVEITTGVFRHFGAGTLIKEGAYTGGEFVVGTSWEANDTDNPYSDSNYGPFDGQSRNGNRSTAVRCEVDGHVWWLSWPWGYGNANKAICSHRVGIHEDLVARSPNTFNGQTILMPLSVMVERGAQSGLYSPIGTAPRIRQCSIHTLTPRDVIVLGSDTWQVFPLVTKNTGNPTTGDFGLAYLKD